MAIHQAMNRISQEPRIREVFETVLRRKALMVILQSARASCLTILLRILPAGSLGISSLKRMALGSL